LHNPSQRGPDAANLKQSEQLSYTDIISPIDGIVLSRDVQMHYAVSRLVLIKSVTLIMTLGDTSEVYVKGKVDRAISAANLAASRPVERSKQDLRRQGDQDFSDGRGER
jgi:hypothetical protein